MKNWEVESCFVELNELSLCTDARFGAIVCGSLKYTGRPVGCGWDGKWSPRAQDVDLVLRKNSGTKSFHWHFSRTCLVIWMAPLQTVENLAEFWRKKSFWEAYFAPFFGGGSNKVNMVVLGIFP